MFNFKINFLERDSSLNSRTIFILARDTLVLSILLFLIFHLVESLRPYTIQMIFNHYLLVVVIILSMAVMYLAKNISTQKIRQVLNQIHEPLQKIGYVNLWRISLILSVVVILLIVAYNEMKTTVRYTYVPGQKNRWITNHHDNPVDSPVIEMQRASALLLNQPETQFDLLLTDIFETLTVKVFYNSPVPNKLAIYSDHERSTPVIDSGQIILFDKLTENPEWIWEPQPFSSSDSVTFYQKPGLPETFLPFEEFVEKDTIKRSLNEAKVFVVKNDQNIEYDSLTHDFQLHEIAYLLVPVLEKINYTNLVEKTPQGLYVVELKEDLYPKIRKRGANYKFSLVIEGIELSDWAAVEKIEVTAERKPVSQESLQRFLPTHD